MPTSYYTAVQFVCRPTIVDHPHAKVDSLTAQLGDLQPEGNHAQAAVDQDPYGRMLPGIRGQASGTLSVEKALSMLQEGTHKN